MYLYVIICILFLVQVNKTQFDKILSYIEHGKREGATLLTGGQSCGEKGYYIEPTVFTNVTVISFLFSKLKKDIVGC